MKKLALMLLCFTMLTACACSETTVENDKAEETTAEDTNSEDTAVEDSIVDETTADTLDIETSAQSEDDRTDDPTAPSDGIHADSSSELTPPSEKLMNSENYKLLEQILAKDDFDITIVDTSINKDLSTGELSLYGNDTLTFVMESKVEEELTNTALIIIGIDADGNLSYIRESTLIDVIDQPLSTDPIFRIDSGRPLISDDGSFDLSVWCSCDKFEYIFACVAAYTQSDGTIVENPIAEELENMVSHRVYNLEPLDSLYSEYEPFAELTALEETASDFGLQVYARYGFYNMNTSSLLNPDALRLGLVNNTDKTIRDCSIYAVGLSDDGGSVSINWELSRNKEGVVNVFSAANASIAAGATYAVDLECFLGDFVTARAIVASYTTEDGTVYENPIANDWVTVATVTE